MNLDPPERLVSELGRVREAWDEVPFVERRRTVDPEEYEEHRAACYDDRSFVYAGALVTRDGELLLVSPEWSDGWAEPGGTHEPGETVEETARREAREETGLRIELTGVSRANLLELTTGDREPLWSLGVTFEATPVEGDLRPEPGEIDDVGWFETLPDALTYENYEEAVPDRFC
ncbi:ADP-ribose pyrophosphatase [Halobacteriales archaeon QS_8_69_26]|nr:MAG: ADP-ribose pyrophosphatase [Halobacteriales archaeon QS_8_69_26]